MVQFSWPYIVENFESVRRSEEFMMLTKEEMEKLIGSPDLKTVCEDNVLETIFSWVDYKPTEIVDETRRIVYECETPGQTQIGDTLSESSSKVQDLSTLKVSQLNEHEQPQTEGPLSENNTAVYQHQDVSPSNESQRIDHEQSQTDAQLSEKSSAVSQQQDMPREDIQKIEHEKQTKRSSRADHLTNLLRLTRVCLLSGKCLVETMSKVNVRTNKAAQEILQSALEYILRTDRRHDFCPTSAIHRSVSHLKNLIVATESNNSTDILVCRRKDGHWYGLGNYLKKYFSWSLIACYNNDVYVSADSMPIHVYDISRKMWKAIPGFESDARADCLLPIGNFLYVVRSQSKFYSINMISLLDLREWKHVCSLPLDIGPIKCSTVIGDKLLFFGSIARKPETKIVIFDTATLRCTTLKNTPSLPSAKVCFSNDKDSFVLQKDGTLYRIRACPDAPFIEIEYETILWDFDRDIRGAVLFNDELWLFGPSFSSSDTDAHWELSVPGVFKCVKNIVCSEEYSCFMHTVIPKEYLVRIIQ